MLFWRLLVIGRRHNLPRSMCNSCVGSFTGKLGDALERGTHGRSALLTNAQTSWEGPDLLSAHGAIATSPTNGHG